MNDYTTTESNENMEFPAIYIPSYFFTKPYESCENIDDKPIFKKEYFINGLSFYEEPFEDTNVFQECEITTDKDKLEIKILDRYSRVKDTSSVQEVQIDIRETPYGIIITDCLFVAENSWHSIVSEQCGMRCMVCDVTVDKSKDHIKLKTHVDNLNKYDLYFFNKFDENIMRKIGDNYQCVICNVFFNVSNMEKHFESEEHAAQILYSTNQGYDIIDFELAIDTEIDDSDSRTSEESDVDESVISSNDENISDNNISSVDNENDDRRNLMKVDKPYRFEFIYLKIKNTYIQVSYKSYNGLINIRDSIHFCFLCSLIVYGSLKEHMEDVNHLIHLKNVLQHVGDAHIEEIHNSKKLNTNQEKPHENINSKNQINTDSETRNLCNENINHESNEDLICINLNTPSVRLSYIYKHLDEFEYKLRVSFMSLNFVCQRTSDYYCGACHFSSSELHMKRHIQKRRHMEKVWNIPFLINFGENLIREVNQEVHCAICNIFFSLPQAYKHTPRPTHIKLLKAATIKSPNHKNKVPTQQLQINQFAIESTSMNQTEIAVKKSSKNRKEKDVNESRENVMKVEEPHNFEYIYLKFKKTHVKVSYKSYNGLINIDDGSHYCFLCSLRVFGSFKEHMEDENHLIHLNSCHFIDKYDKHLLRQNSFAYHCCNCNIIFTKKQLSAHTTRQEKEFKSDKKTREKDFKSGIKQINIKTIQESAVSNEESKITIITRIGPKKADGKFEIEKCKKIVVINGNALKISWDNWHGFSNSKFDTYCILCQSHFKVYEIDTHVSGEKHKSFLEKSFETKFLPSLIRKINDNKLHCLVCNVKVLDISVFDHINSKKHKNNLTINHIDIENLFSKDILYV